MSHEGIVIIKEPNGVIAEEFLTEVLGEYKSCSGAAFSDNDDLDVSRNAGPADLKMLEKIQEDFLDKRIVFYFGTHPEGSPEDEIQPFTILKDSNDDPVVVAFIDGEFPGFDKPASAHSSAFHYVNEHLIKIVHAAYANAGGDMDKLIENFGNMQFRENVKSQLKRGAVVLMTYDGSAVAIPKSESIGDFDDFWTSDKLGYEEEKEESKEAPIINQPVIPVVEKKKSGKLQMGFTSDQPKPEPEKKEPTKPVDPPKDAPPKTEDGYILMKCPTEISKNQGVRDWYNYYAGVVPGNYKNRPEARVSMIKIREAAKNNKAWAKAIVEKQTRPFRELEEKINQPAAQPTNALPAKPPVVDPAVASPLFPTEAEIGKYFKDFSVRPDLDGLLDSAGKPVPLDVKNIQATEGKWTPIWDVMKTNPLKMARWSDEALVIFMSQYPRFRLRVLRALLNEIAILRLSNLEKPAEETNPIPTVEKKRQRM